MLSEMPEVTELHPVPDAHVPVMKFKFNGVSIDLLYAKLSLWVIPEVSITIIPMYYVVISYAFFTRELSIPFGFCVLCYLGAKMYLLIISYSALEVLRGAESPIYIFIIFSFDACKMHSQAGKIYAYRLSYYHI